MGRGDDYPVPSSAAVSAVMRANKRADTRPEQCLRSALHRLGLRFRKDFPVATAQRRVRVDVAFQRARVAVFVDGCFWHACPLHGTSPNANAAYWRVKFERNVARDRDVDRALQEAGWSVIRAWEHEDPDAVAVSVQAAVLSTR